MKYVVQRLSYVGGDLKDAPNGAWVDVATVEAAPKAKRKTVLKAAKLVVGADAEEFRVLDEASAHVHTVEAEQQTVLRIT
jgi:hypothetical protein